ncbi:MAG TPA: hypothetical protein VF472_23630 [Burkholderiaceae bacterium]
MSFGSFFRHLGHAIEHGAEDLVHGVEHAAKDVGKAVVSQLHTIEDLAQGKFKDALNSEVRTVTDLAKAGTDIQKAEVDAATDAITNMHISKTMDKMAQKVKSLDHKLEDGAVKVVNQVASGVANDAFNTVKGTLNAAKDLAQGHFGAALSDGLGALASGASLASDLTPEGLAANTAVAAMQTAHIGGPVLQNVVGDMVGGPKNLAKRAVNAGKDALASTAANAVGGALSGNSSAAAAGVIGGLEIGASFAGGRSKRSRSESETVSRGGFGPESNKRQRTDNGSNSKSDKLGNIINFASFAAGGGGGGIGGGKIVAAAGADAADAIATSQALANINMATQNKLAQISNEENYNMAANQISENGGKNAKSLTQG